MSQNDNQQRPVNPKIDRLPSLRPPRDLTLAGGGSNGPTFGPARSKFTPNLTLAGKRQTPQTSDGHQNSDHRGGGGGNRGRGGRGRGGAGRGRGKYEPEIIQSKGIFSDGFSETAAKNSSFSRDSEASGGGGFSSGGGRSGFVTGRRGQENASSETISQAGVKYEPMETDEVALSSLFKDNFISDLKDGSIHPILLPFSDLKNEQIQRVKQESSPICETVNDQSIFDDIFSETSKNKNPDGSFVFIQLPSILSDMLTKNDADVEPKREIKTEECEETEKPVTNSDKKETPKKLSVFESVPEGLLGKLQLLKSGRLRLKLMSQNEDQPIYFDVGFVPTSFAQELVSIQCDNPELNEGRMNVIGDKISHKMLVTPNVENIVKTLKH